MAGDEVKGRVENHPESAVEKLRIEHNKLIDDLETLRAEVVAETTSVLAAAALTAGKVGKK